MIAKAYESTALEAGNTTNRARRNNLNAGRSPELSCCIVNVTLPSSRNKKTAVLSSIPEVECLIEILSWASRNRISESDALKSTGKRHNILYVKTLRNTNVMIRLRPCKSIRANVVHILLSKNYTSSIVFTKEGKLTCA